MDAYDLPESQFIQTLTFTSGANALNIATTACPLGKIWTILAAFGTCSAAETQDYWWSIQTPSLDCYPVTMPQEVVINGALSRYVPLVREGLEIRVFQKEKLMLFRDANTAGSTISLYMRFIESDMPLYEYIEPQEKKRLNQMRSSITRIVGGGAAPSRPAGVFRSSPGPRTRLPGR